MKKIFMLSIALLFSISLNGCKNPAAQISSPSPAASQTASPTNTPAISPTAAPTISATSVPANASIVYENNQYGFRFTLPEGWKGYTIVDEKWNGLALAGAQTGKIVENGPIIYIRHPQWTAEKPRQDIPIMIFTITQWNSLQNQEISVGAAPIPPSELGRNSRYVFALPARYNYAFPTGYEEVESILKSNPLQVTEGSK
jgi:hypothetical protein